MLVTRLEELARGKRRVWLEGGPRLVLYRREVEELELQEGSELTPQRYREILTTILIPRARKRAMHLLERMDRTEAQLREKLLQNEYPQEAVEDAVSYVKSFHYVDDQRYALNYVRYRCQSRSRRQLEAELARKGVDRELIRQALEEECSQDEGEKILRWMEKKHYDPAAARQKEKQRMYQFLLRKGFRWEDIMRYLT